MSTQTRRAEAGELCTCGRQATLVFVHDDGRETGYCGQPDGGDQSGPCRFCGAPRRSHEGRCPEYQVRPADGDDEGESHPDDPDIDRDRDIADGMGAL